MVPYLAIVAAATLTAYIACKFVGRREYLALIGLSVAIVCIAAGLRGTNVGTDMGFYGVPGFNLARTGTFEEFMSRYHGWHPIGFCLITWLFGHYIGSRVLYFAVLQLLVILPVAIVLLRRSKEHFWIGMFIYTCFLFPISLNGMKQMIVCGWSVFAVDELLRSRPFTSLAVLSITMTMHFTAILQVPLFALVLVVKYRDRLTRCWPRYKSAIYVIALAAALAIASVLLNLREVIMWLSQFKPSLAYALGTLGSGEIYESALVLLAVVFLCELSIFRCGWFSGCSEKDIHLIAFIALAVGLILLQADALAPSLYRIGMVGLCFAPIWLSTIADVLNMGGVRGRAIVCAALFVFGIYSVYTYGVTGAQGIIPFTLSL